MTASVCILEFNYMPSWPVQRLTLRNLWVFWSHISHICLFKLSVNCWSHIGISLQSSSNLCYLGRPPLLFCVDFFWFGHFLVKLPLNHLNKMFKAIIIIGENGGLCPYFTLIWMPNLLTVRSSWKKQLFCITHTPNFLIWLQDVIGVAASLQKKMLKDASCWILTEQWVLVILLMLSMLVVLSITSFIWILELWVTYYLWLLHSYIKRCCASIGVETF